MQQRLPPKRQNLYEVWGDTIDGRDLAMSIGIGAVVSLGAYFAAQQVLHHLVESAQMARAYAMLIGILGCLAGGAISARLFAPKRDVQENVADQSFREQVVADLLKEYGSLGRLEDLSAEVIAELRELELYELFREAQAREENVPVAQAPALTPSLSGGRG
ncbi:hypothetical protein NTD80_22555 [Pseudomonas sp. 13B_2.1_Bac1]|jgi:hypothetical protein|uniref:hypothetical protein n=1 Tax=unclassified Pseudomonas TaxID=196821 RepID=UPI001912AE0F|nr:MULTISPECIES: hypothetical protein [unclassified Pseudomonas]MBK5476578.1 hypothetical protein [Pseudomonas sp. TH21]MBS7844528.1 hypothetical protein [Pseudomonas fluorescens]MCU1785534.1 hypothetical protein [Pseudomonas sp. 13B_2.1_Bac1]